MRLTPDLAWWKSTSILELIHTRLKYRYGLNINMAVDFDNFVARVDDKC